MSKPLKKKELHYEKTYFQRLVYDWKREVSKLLKPDENAQREFEEHLRKDGIIAKDFAERVRGSIFLVFGFSAMGAAVIASTAGVLELQAIVQGLIESDLGRVVLFFIGLAYFIAGAWRLFSGKT